MSDSNVDAAIGDELKALLSDLSPDEAPFANDYVAKAGTADAATDSVFNYPGGAEAVLIGKWLFGIMLGIATEMLVAAKKEGIKAGAEAAVAWLKARFPKAPPVQAPSREETLLKVSREMEGLHGWSKEDARVAAESIWRTAENTSDRLVILANEGMLRELVRRR